MLFFETHMHIDIVESEAWGLSAGLAICLVPCEHFGEGGLMALLKGPADM